MSFDNDYGKPEPAREDIDRLSGPVLLEFGTGWCGYCQAIQRTAGNAPGRVPGHSSYQG